MSPCLAVRGCGWIPEIGEVMGLSREKLAGHRLEFIKYRNQRYFHFLTLVFTGDVHNPPLGSYQGDPNIQINVPLTLRSVKFKFRHGFLLQLQLGENEDIGNSFTDQNLTLKLLPNESVVSASI